MTQRFLQSVYARRPAPKEYDAAWISLEFARINAAIANIPRNTGQGTTSPSQTITCDRIEAGSASFGPSPVSSLNLVEYSQQFDKGTWQTVNGAIITGNSAMAPDGTLTAATLNSPEVSGYVQSSAFTVLSSTKVTISVHIKRLTTTSQTNYGIVDLTTGANVAETGALWTGDAVTGLANTGGGSGGYVITSLGNGWYRCSGLTNAFLDPTHTYAFYIYARNHGNTGSIYVWGAQVNSGALIPYIETRGLSTALAVAGNTVLGPTSINTLAVNTLAVSGLTASRPVMTNASKQLASATVTGTGSVVLSASPTLTGTTTMDGLTLAADKSIKTNLGRYSTDFPWSYMRLGSTSSGLRISNAADLLNLLELANTGYLSLLVAQTTPSELSATQYMSFASTVSGATLMGYGTTGDVTLKSRAGSDALYVVANSVNVRAKGSLTSDAAAGGIGYATGAGGTVAQGAGSGKATAFTLSKVTGQITTDGANLAADTTVSATWTNTAIAATDVVAINHLSGGTIGAYSFNVQCGAGTATLSITNRSAGALAEALVLSFVVLKGVTA